MTFEELKLKYPGREPAFPEHLNAPNDSDLIMDLIVNHGCNFSKSYIDFQLIHCHSTPMGDFAKEGFCWANKSAKVECSLMQLILNFRDSKYPDYLTPFKIDDEGYWCFDTRIHFDNGEYPIVVFSKSEKVIRPEWTNFVEWLDATMEENY